MRPLVRAHFRIPLLQFLKLLFGLRGKLDAVAKLLGKTPALLCGVLFFCRPGLTVGSLPSD